MRKEYQNKYRELNAKVLETKSQLELKQQEKQHKMLMLQKDIKFLEAKIEQQAKFSTDKQKNFEAMKQKLEEINARLQQLQASFQRYELWMPHRSFSGIDSGK